MLIYKQLATRYDCQTAPILCYMKIWMR